MPTTIPNTIEISHQTYPLLATRRKGTKRFVLRFNAKKQAVTLSIPMRASMKEALKFAHAQTVWLENQIVKSGEKIALEPGAVISILGEDVLLKHEAGRGVATRIPSPIGGGLGRGHVRTQSNDAPLPTSPLQGEEIHATLTIHGDRAFFNRRLKDWLTAHLREETRRLAQEKTAILGVKFSRIQIRDADSHWGSCSPSGTLSFTFRLVFASAAQIDYIVCHEVAHLREMNHSPQFWKLVESLCPDYAKHRRWLKTHGHTLGRFVI